MAWLQRDEWLAPAPKAALQRMALPVSTVFLHHTVTPVSSDPKADFRKVTNYSKYVDVPYTVMVHPDGTIATGRYLNGVPALGAHTSGKNSVSLGVAVLGNYVNDQPTQAAIDSVATVLSAFIANGFITTSFVLKAHQDAPYATACLPLDETDLLTPEGWIPLGSIKTAEVVPQWENGVVSFVRTVGAVVPYLSKVTKVRKSEMTDNHRVVYRGRHSEPWKIKTFDQINSDVFLPHSGISNFKGMNISEDYLRFLVWVQADGHYKYETKIDGSKGYYGIEFHFKKQRKIDSVLDIVESLDMPVKVNEHMDGTVSLSIYGAEHVHNAEKYLSNKCFTWDWLNMSMSQFKAFWEELLQADGCTANNSYSSNQKINTEIVQAILVTHGRKSHIYSDGRARGDRVFSQGEHYQINLNKNSREKLSSRETLVGCVEVPSGVIVVRQYGQAYVVGNCCGTNLKVKIAEILGKVGHVSPVYTPQPVKQKPQTPISNHPAYPMLLRKGSKGVFVVQLQQKLKDRGWKITVDGDFGPATDKVVRAYQKEKGLSVDGLIGPATWNSIFKSPVT